MERTCLAAYAAGLIARIAETDEELALELIAQVDEIAGVYSSISDSDRNSLPGVDCIRHSDTRDADPSKQT